MRLPHYEREDMHVFRKSRSFSTAASPEKKPLAGLRPEHLDDVTRRGDRSSNSIAAVYTSIIVTVGLVLLLLAEGGWLRHISLTGLTFTGTKEVSCGIQAQLQ